MKKYELMNMDGIVISRIVRKSIESACDYFSSLFEKESSYNIRSEDIAFIHICEFGCSVCYGVFKK